MHYERYFKLYSPAYAWWLCAYERFNGLLKKVKTNNHPEDYETIMARFWTCMHRKHELVTFLPEDVGECELSIIKEMCKSVGSKGTTLATKVMLAQEIHYTTRKHSSRATNLHSLPICGLYYLLLDFAHTCWPELNLTSDLELTQGGYPFIHDRVAKILPFIYRNGIKFGYANAKRTQADRFAFVKFDSLLVPCRIEYLFCLTVKDKAPQLCAVVAQLVADKEIPAMPWDE
ncbi:hypothetical protein FS749_003616 [Ceratobasidium sp. UAMH 11750]|nr:hypothetical protein FS749_003616 [Ceratobasidium sp. UAMH 11750]